MTFFFQSLKQVVVGLLIRSFFFPIFEMGLVIGMLNRCGFELAVGY